MAGLFKKIASYGGLGGAPGAYATNKSFRKGVNQFLTGDPESQEYVSRLRPDQEPLSQQAINAGMGKGAGGAFGGAADYYYNNLSDNPADFEAFAAPERRAYNEQIIPDLAEQFAGMGSGNLSSSGFTNAAIGAGTDLTERLAQIRANLRSQSAQGLQNIGQSGLQPFGQNVIRPATPGFLQSIAPAVGNLVTQGAGQMMNSAKNSFGQSSPYGNAQSNQALRMQAQSIHG